MLSPQMHAFLVNESWKWRNSTGWIYIVNAQYTCACECHKVLIVFSSEEKACFSDCPSMNISDALSVLPITFRGFCLKKNAFWYENFPRWSLCCLVWFPFLVLLVSRSGLMSLPMQQKLQWCLVCSSILESFELQLRKIKFQLDVWWFQYTVDLWVTMPWVIIEKEGIIPVLLLVLCYVWGCH